MPLALIAALQALATVRGLRDPVQILLQAPDNTPRRPHIAWWLK